MISAEQCRAARALLDWEQKTLAVESQLSLSSIRAFERDKERKAYPSTILALRIAFERADIVFINNDEGAGVFLKMGRRPSVSMH